MKECKEEEELFGEDRTVYLESCQDGWFTFYSLLYLTMTILTLGGKERRSYHGLTMVLPRV